MREQRRDPLGGPAALVGLIDPAQRLEGERFGLNARQVEILSIATPKRDYYAQTARGNRLFELGLGPIALALCGASDPATYARIDSLLADGEDEFAARFLAVSGLPWAADLLASFPATPQPQE